MGTSEHTEHRVVVDVEDIAAYQTTNQDRHHRDGGTIGNPLRALTRGKGCTKGDPVPSPTQARKMQIPTSRNIKLAEIVL